MTPNELQLLEAEGWTVECESPLEIRHEDGSFATGYAAQMVIGYLVSQNAEGRVHGALNTIQGCAHLAKQSCEGQMQKLWEAVENECRKALTA